MPESPRVYISRPKQDYIYEQGFKFNLRRRIFIHRKEKVIMSFEFASKYDLDVIKRVLDLRDGNSEDGWTIHFISELSPRLRKQFIKAVEE
jgi:hypothetical protein